MPQTIGHGWPSPAKMSSPSSPPSPPPPGWPAVGEDAHPILLEALARHVPPAVVEDVVERTGRRERRRRRLPAVAVVWLVLMMGLRRDLDQPGAWRHVRGFLASVLDGLAGIRPPAKSALARARRRLGARPMRQLMLATASPAAAAAGGAAGGACHDGAFYKGMRLMAMDGDDYKIPDTPANAKAFGRPGTARDGTPLPAGYPQLHLNRLIEVGTRVTREAIVKPCHAGDHAAAPRLLAATRPGELVLWDCGFHSHRLLRLAAAGGRWFLGRVPSHVVLTPLRRLADGSYLARVYATPNDRRDDRDGLTLRVIEYTLDEPLRTGHGERHRLITNLLDAEAYPAMELIVLYHQRWEIEIANDEITTHQLAAAVELRSRTPAGVVQELYGVLAAHNAVRAIMCEAAARVDVDPRRLGFMRSVRLVREAMAAMRDAPTQRLPLLYAGMLAAIAASLLPPRDGRINPRVVKVVRPSNFPAKKPHHLKPPQPAKSFIESIVMLK